MKVRVKLFAVAKELAGRDELSIELPAGASIADLGTVVGQQYPALDGILSHALWAVDTQYANDNTPINENSDVALIPPVSGG
jgi:molybdopterin converting factor subunit 1